jgi:hypothetical protein
MTRALEGYLQLRPEQGQLFDPVHHLMACDAEKPMDTSNSPLSLGNYSIADAVTQGGK